VGKDGEAKAGRAGKPGSLRDRTVDGGPAAPSRPGKARKLTLGLVLAALAAGCTESPSPHAGAVVLDAWAHAGRQEERHTLRDQVAHYNRQTDGVEIRLTLLPEGSYNSQVQAAALADDLPDILEFDGPFVYNYVWQGRLRPIGDRLSEAVRTNALPSILEQGTYRGRLYSMGMYDSGLALYGRRSLLEKAGARIPESPADAWTVDEFDTLLAALAANDPDGRVLDLKLNYQGEWFTYAFLPVLVSAGGDLIDRSDFQSADGVLNGPEAVRAMRALQRWIHEREWVDENVDDHAFVGGRVALSWVGHWELRRYRAAWSNDLVLVPLPDFGTGSRTGQGSWNWGVTKKCRHPDEAVRFIEHLLGDERIVAMTRANAAVPGSRSAVAASPLYREESLLRLFVDQLTDGASVPRPRTPAYPILTTVFQQAFHDIRHGADVRAALDQAVADIDRDIRDNRGYPEVANE
jgi:multiple sugar transport system substrate-binding protein